MDTINSERRSANMRAIKSADTSPEMRVRRMVHALGYRFRLHRRDLPGTPDLTFVAQRKVVLVHGCFWHQHQDPRCRKASHPKSHIDYWGPKLERNVQRDEETQEALKADGWAVLVVWECETLGDTSELERKIISFLSGDAGQHTKRYQ